jgi:hypothetical protein
MLTDLLEPGNGAGRHPVLELDLITGIGLWREAAASSARSQVCGGRSAGDAQDHWQRSGQRGWRGDDDDRTTALPVDRGCVAVEH